MSNPARETRRHNPFGVDLTGAPERLDPAMAALNAHAALLATARAFVAFLDLEDRTCCGLEHLERLHPGIDEVFARARAAVAKATPR